MNTSIHSLCVAHPFICVNKSVTSGVQKTYSKVYLITSEFLNYVLVKLINPQIYKTHTV